MESLALERLFRRVQMLFGRGRVTGVNDAGTIQVMQVKMNDRETGDNRYRVAEFGFTSVPPDGSDALVVFVSGDRGTGAVVATNHQASRPTGLQTGESMLYSKDGKQIHMTASGGIVVNANGQNVVINGAADVTWNCSGTFTLNAPNIVLNGNTQLNGNISQAGAEGAAGTATFTAPINAPDVVLPNGAVNDHDHYVPAAPGTSDPMAS